MVEIKINNLTKHYGDVRALDNVSITIDSGDFLVLLGPSGCGKTTLLRCIAGLEVPDKGEILIDGRAVFRSADKTIVPPGQRNIGMVFQSYALWPHMSVRKNVAFGLE
ncbi:MAG: ABC transporter ATP-binding protein, partial [Rhodospirillales bacterium]|nr:ABC transporter ATP-binding protein [Rhodospirillales bacterium]